MDLQVLGQYKSIIVDAPSGGVDAGEFVNYGGIHGFYYAPTPVGAEVAIIWACDYMRLPKLASIAITGGATLYWDTSESHVTNVASGNHEIGRAAKPAAATTTEVDLILWGLV